MQRSGWTSYPDQPLQVCTARGVILNIQVVAQRKQRARRERPNTAFRPRLRSCHLHASVVGFIAETTSQVGALRGGQPTWSGTGRRALSVRPASYASPTVPLQDDPYKISSLTLTAKSCLEVHKPLGGEVLRGSLTVLMRALRIAVAWTLLSLSFAAFWVLLLELGSRFGRGPALKPSWEKPQPRSR
jgi:hypothetical protein